MQIQSSNITSILDVCLERMRRGESIEACVHDYPAEAEELEPLLITIMYARSSFLPPSLSPEARQAIQRKLRRAVAAARQPAPQQTSRRWLGPVTLRFALALIVALLSLGGGVAAAQSSLPGSSLYPLKRASETVRLRLASSATERAELHLDFAAARSAEMLALANGEHKTVSGSLVDDLDQEYQQAWAEIGQVPVNEVSDLVGRYVVERQADVRAFSATMPRANAATQAQIRRAVRLSEQALATVGPSRRPVPQPAPNNGVNTESTPDADAPNPGGVPANAGPKPTQEGKPADARPKPTPEGKPADAGSPATPETKPENKPNNTDPKPKQQPKPGHGKP